MFCPKCGTQMTEAGQCPKCNPVQPTFNANAAAPAQPVVNANMVAPAASSLTKAAWYVPATIIASSLVGAIVGGIIGAITGGIASATGEYAISNIGNSIISILTIVITLGVAWFLYGMAFKTANPKEQTVCKLFIMAPLALLWFRNVLSGAFSTFFYAIAPIEVYSVLSTIASVIATIVVIVLSYILAQKLLGMVETALKD